MKRTGMILMLVLLMSFGCDSAPTPAATPAPSVVAVLHTYEARIRFEGKLSTTQVKASDGGQAKRLVQQQFPKATVMSIKRID